MRRGEIIAVADPDGDYSRKPRPALIVQNDLFNATHPSITVCLFTGFLTGFSIFRIAVPADDVTGLKKPSEVEIDKVQAIRLDRVGGSIGSLPEPLMAEVDMALKRWLAF